jgi:glycosyltransferase involved in cell wall biosynthesis
MVDRQAGAPGKLISIVLPSLRGGGAERVSINLAKAMVALGHEVEFALLDARGEFLLHARRSFSVVDLKVKRARWAVPACASYLRSRRPQAVIAMMWPLSIIVPVAAGIARLDTRILVCEHSMISRQYRDWGLVHNLLLRASVAVGYRLAHRRAGVSDGVARDMASLARLSCSEVATLHNPVPKQSPGEQEIARADALWSSAGPRLLTVGSFKPAKNYLLLLRAFATLDLPGARLMVVGQGEGETELRALALELGIADRVIFAGFHTDPSAFYATADLFVLSSDYEGLPTVLIEALSFGLPVVSTDCPSGPAEILENGRWGRLVPVGDANALARAMGEAAAAPVDREALKRRAADFSPEIAARRYLELLGLS